MSAEGMQGNHEEVSEVPPTQQDVDAEYKRLFGRFPRAVLCANKHETWDKARCVAIMQQIEMKLQVNRGSCWWVFVSGLSECSFHSG